jgi:hypothetical protein
MHPDDLKTVWECRQCGRRFLYESDATGHSSEFGHLNLISKDLTRRPADAVFVRKNISLTFRFDGAKAKVHIDFKYYPSIELIEYSSVSYTDERLKDKIERNAEMMSNIDNYIRNICNAESREDSHLP